VPADTMRAPRTEAGAWLAARPLWLRIALAALAGAVMTGGHVPVSLPWGWFLAVPVLIWLTDTAYRPWQAALIGWAAGYGYFVSGLHWIGHAFLVDPERHAWMMPFAVALLPAGIALFWGGALALARWLWPAGWWRALVFAAALALAELARGHLLTGFPWALPAYIWVETPIAQAASWAGPYGLSLITLILAGLPLTAAGPRPGGRMVSGLALAGVIALWLAGDERLSARAEADRQAPVIRIVQPNAAQDRKWNPDHTEGFYRRLIALSTAPGSAELGHPDLVIWPETALTALPQHNPALLREIAAATRGAPVITGALFYRTQGDTRYWSNALAVIGADGRLIGRYDKHHLVPFGEYMPLKSLLARLGIRALAGKGGGGFEPGPGPRRIALEGLPSFAPAICYEMIFPGEVVPPGPRPDWILHLTNDAWFGRFAGPQQHLAQAQFRAIEQGLPVLRAANTGISALIDPRGRVRHSIALGAHGGMDVRLLPSGPRTFYTRTGGAVGIALIGLILIGSLAHHYLLSSD